MKKIIIVILLLFHISFYFSALTNEFYNYFFSWGNVHEHQGIDFYQVPNGASAYLKGGKLNGELPPNFFPYHFGNINVYHPFFTLTVGTPLQMITPEVSLKIWILFHLLLYLGLYYIFYRHFNSKKNFILGSALFLMSFPQALEIWNGQYHFLLDTAIFFIILGISKKDTLSNGLWYLLSLLVKPITILWLLPLVIHKRYKSLTIGLILFVFFTLLFLINGDGKYYIDNLIERIKHPIGTPPGVFTLDALMRFWKVNESIIKSSKFFVVLALVIFQLKYKTNLFKSIFMWTSFYLIFYDFVFEYHYTTIGLFLAFAVITEKLFSKNIIKGLALTYILPTPFFLFHFFQVLAHEHYVENSGWVILVLFRIIPLIMINMLIIFFTIHDRKKRIAKTVV